MTLSVSKIDMSLTPKRCICYRARNKSPCCCFVGKSGSSSGDGGLQFYTCFTDLYSLFEYTFTCIGILFAHFHMMMYRCCGVLYLALKREVQNATQHLYIINLSSNELYRNVLFLTDLERCISLSLFLNRFKYLTNQKA